MNIYAKNSANDNDLHLLAVFFSLSLTSNRSYK